MNFLEVYQSYAEHITDAPLDFSRFLSLATAGVLLGNSRYVQFGTQKIYPNFYMTLLAPSSLYRKTTALTISQNLVFSKDDGKIFATDFSQEKIMETLSQTSCGVFYYYEFKTLLSLMERNYMLGLKSMLTELYDCPLFIKVARKSNSYIIHNPCISILSATTSDWFTESIKEQDIEGGFLARFLYVYSKTKPRHDSFPKSPDPVKLKMRQSTIDDLLNTDSGEMTFSEGAKHLYSLWDQHFAILFETYNPTYRNLFARLPVYVIKICIVLESCLTGLKIISESAVEQALVIANELIKSTQEVCETELTFSKSDLVEKKLLKHLKKSPEPMQWVKLMRLSHLSGRDFYQTIESLKEKEIIKINVETNGTDKPRKMIVLLPKLKE